MSTVQRTPSRLPDGVYVPTVTFFENQQVDYKTLETHLAYLLTAGVTGLVVHGSNGEAVHLSNSEREEIIRAARRTIDAHPRRGPAVPLIAGCGAQSNAEIVSLCKAAAAAGATHALVLPPSYYSTLVTKRMLIDCFCVVADQSPIPLVIYNYPGGASGRDLDSDAILEIAKHPNVAGVKLTCGNTGKLARVAAGAPDGFFTGGGSADFILQGHVVGGNGTISGLANICPRACLELLRLAKEEKYKEARELQAAIAEADWTAIQSGFVGVKIGLKRLYGYNPEPRLPCHVPDDATVMQICNEFLKIWEVEKSLEKQSMASTNT